MASLSELADCLSVIFPCKWSIERFCRLAFAKILTINQQGRFFDLLTILDSGYIDGVPQGKCCLDS